MKNKSVGLAAENAIEHFDYSSWTLVLMDLNVTCLWREFISFQEGYGPCTLRPHLKEFWRTVALETRTVVGIWTGASSEHRAKVLLEHLKGADITTRDICCWIGALPGCKSKKTFENTTKPIVVKPVSVLQSQILPQFKQAGVSLYVVYVSVVK